MGCGWKNKHDCVVLLARMCNTVMFIKFCYSSLSLFVDVNPTINADILKPFASSNSVKISLFLDIQTTKGVKILYFEYINTQIDTTILS